MDTNASGTSCAVGNEKRLGGGRLGRGARSARCRRVPGCGLPGTAYPGALAGNARRSDCWLHDEERYARRARERNEQRDDEERHTGDRQLSLERQDHDISVRRVESEWRHDLRQGGLCAPDVASSTSIRNQRAAPSPMLRPERCDDVDVSAELTRLRITQVRDASKTYRQSQMPPSN